MAPSSAQQHLLSIFRNIPNLTLAPLGDAVDFSFPKIDVGVRPERVGRVKADVSESRIAPSSAQDKPVAALISAINQAASKPEFGRTSLASWRANLVFQADRVQRNGRSKRLKWTKEKLPLWDETREINESEESAQQWFELFLERINAGSTFKHSHALVGGPGCGKSTLVKYLISANASTLNRVQIVFSRFEFLKFWNWHESNPNELIVSLRHYMSFIHARDLILSQFFDMNGDQFDLKLDRRLGRNFEAKLEELIEKLVNTAPLIGDELNDASIFRLRAVLSQINTIPSKSVNKELMRRLKSLTHELRLLLIAALSDHKTLVTVFDGMDSLKLEDAWAKSPKWDAVRDIVLSRRILSSHRELADKGIILEVDSLTIMRDNTVALMELEARKYDTALEFAQYFRVGKIDGLAAMVAVVERSAEMLNEFSNYGDDQRDEFVFNIMTVIQRTWLAICRGNGVRVRRSLIYNFFDGNLRDLFAFIAIIIRWSVTGMWNQKHALTEDYSTSVLRLSATLASAEGKDFLHRKSYRVIEPLLFSRDNGWFENAISVEKIDSVLFNSSYGTPQANPWYSGQIDNVFNYMDSRPQNGIDSHALLEKIRVIQLVAKKPMSDRQLVASLKNTFGYNSQDIVGVIALLLKTDFITAEIVKGDHQYQNILRATAKGVVCVESIMTNMLYVEHVFHRTLFPTVLIRWVDDKKRSEDLERWVTSSIRNAFIFLSYLKMVESNSPLNRVVPKDFRLFDRLLENLSSTIEKITGETNFRDGEGGDDRIVKLSGEAIAMKASSRIESLLSDWTRRGLVKPAGPRH